MKTVWNGAVMASFFILMICARAAAVEYSGHSFRNPFGTSGSTGPFPGQNIHQTAQQAALGADSTAFKLSGLVWNSESPRAIINDQVVKIGSQIGNFEVVGISKEGVRLRPKKTEFYLHSERDSHAKA